MDNFDLDSTAQHVGKIMGYPAKLMNSETERDEIRQERAEAQQKQEALEQAAMLAKTAKDAGSAAKDMPPEMMGL
jgi:hypothetical protein